MYRLEMITDDGQGKIFLLTAGSTISIGRQGGNDPEPDEHPGHDGAHQAPKGHHPTGDAPDHGSLPEAPQGESHGQGQTQLHQDKPEKG